jgi:hypothetical protein
MTDKDDSVAKHDTIWTNSLFLYPDRVVVKTFDHKKDAWLDAMTRELVEEAWREARQ